MLNGLSVQNVNRWLFVIVVTDPFPSNAFMTEPIQEQMSKLPQQPGVKYHGPFVLSLLEFEQLETLIPNRVSQLLIDWEAGAHKNGRFESFYWARTRGVQEVNEYVRGIGDAVLDQLGGALFPAEDAAT